MLPNLKLKSRSQELGVLKKLIIEGEKAFADNEVARALMFEKRSFSDDLIRFSCSALLLHDGDWPGARECIRMNRDLDEGRVKKLLAWGDTVWQQNHKTATAASAQSGA